MTTTPFTVPKYQIPARRSDPYYNKGLRDQVLIKNAGAAPFVPKEKQLQELKKQQEMQQEQFKMQQQEKLSAAEIMAIVDKAKTTIEIAQKQKQQVSQVGGSTVSPRSTKEPSGQESGLVDRLTNLLMRPDFDRNQQLLKEQQLLNARDEQKLQELLSLKKTREEIPWTSGPSMIPVYKADVAKQRTLVAKTGYQVFLEHYCKKFGKMPPKGSWAYMAPSAIAFFNKIAHQYNTYWQLNL